MDTSKKLTKSVALNATIAALYVVFTLISYPIAFEQIQFRISEILILICFFRRDTVWGLVIGCLIANAFSPMMGWDMLFGTSATLIACLGIIFMPRLAFAIPWPVISNAIIVGAELYFILGLPFWINVLWVGVGELAVMVVGYVVFMLLKRNKAFMNLIGADRHLEVKW